MNDYVETGRGILRTLAQNGHQAYFVGGFVRDFLLHRPSSDIDIATSATPDEVTRIFPGTKATGVRYGTVTVYAGGHGFEVTTFRSEGGYLDARHPGDVAFTASLERDLERRDFTVNAIAMAADGTLVDRFGGQDDLARGILRAIGDPQERFREDALRILRAFRFVAKLDFHIEPETLRGISASAHLLAKVSNERVLTELKYIVRGPFAAKAFRAMVATDVLDVLPPIAAGVRFLAQSAPIALSFEEFAALCFRLDGRGVPVAWRFSNRERQAIERIMTLSDVTTGGRFDELLVYVNGLDLCLAANRVNTALAPAADQEKEIRAMHARMPIHRTCELAFKGDDILATTSVKDARVIGRVIDELVLAVITGTRENAYGPLRAYALELLRTMGEHDGRS